MENWPLISVIVPVYNVEEWIGRCVNSICKQSYQNLQIILVDDGSTDRSGELCDQFAKIDLRIQVIHKSNGGLSDARNVGLTHALGEYVSFIDSDDWVMPQFVEILYNTIKNNCDLAECSFVKTTGKVPKISSSCEITIYDTEQAMEAHIKDYMFRQVVWNKLYRRTVLKVPFEKGKYHEDIYWTYQILAKCKRLAHIEAPLYCYFQRDASIMGQEYSLKRLDAVEAAVRRCKYVTEYFPELAGLAQGQLIGSCMYHYQLMLQYPNVDIDGCYRKWVFSQAKQAGNNWKKNAHISQKQKLWMNLYLKVPQVVCWIRNCLQIGK